MLASNQRGDDLNLFAALDDQPPALLSAQLLTMGVFLTAYLFAVTGLLGTRGRLRCAGVALLAGVALGFLLTPWTLGALFVAGSVGAIGLFIGLSWLLSRALGVHDHAPSMLPEMDIEDEALPLLVTLAAGDRPDRATHGGFAPPTAPAPLG
jgi:hypothetical protein